MYNAAKIFEQLPNFPSCHASTIAELPNGDLLAAWYAGVARRGERCRDLHLPMLIWQ